jgi:predicted ArsR family transcriptional regulator
MLAKLWRASGLLGLAHAPAWDLVRRVGLDSIPKLRRAVLDYLATSLAAPTTTDIAEAVEHPTQTTRRALEDLTAHGVVIRNAGGQGRPDRWELAQQTRDWLDAMTVPVSSGSTDSLSAALNRPTIPNDDKTGKVRCGNVGDF